MPQVRIGGRAGLGADAASAVEPVMQRIVHGSCIGVDASAFDVMLADPPYSAHVHDKATSQSRVRGARHRDLGFDSLSEDLLQYVAGASADVRRWSVVYCDVEGLSRWREAPRHGQYIRSVPWVRWSMPQLSGDRPPQGFELVTLWWGAQRGRKSWNGPGNLTHLAHKCLRGEGKHKAEKPLDQALDLVSWFTEPGEHVFDPCAGSGTMGLACALLDRSYTGYEINAEWAARAAARLVGPLSARDEERAQRWLAAQGADACR